MLVHVPFACAAARFQQGYDEEPQRTLGEPDEEREAQRRKALARECITYGNELVTLLSRTRRGSQLVYEVMWTASPLTRRGRSATRPWQGGAASTAASSTPC